MRFYLTLLLNETIVWSKYFYSKVANSSTESSGWGRRHMPRAEDLTGLNYARGGRRINGALSLVDSIWCHDMSAHKFDVASSLWALLMLFKTFIIFQVAPLFIGQVRHDVLGTLLVPLSCTRTASRIACRPFTRVGRRFTSVEGSSWENWGCNPPVLALRHIDLIIGHSSLVHRVVRRRGTVHLKEAAKQAFSAFLIGSLTKS